MKAFDTSLGSIPPTDGEGTLRTTHVAREGTRAGSGGHWEWDEGAGAAGGSGMERAVSSRVGGLGGRVGVKGRALGWG